VPPDLALLRAALAALERGLRTILLAGDLDAASAASVLAELPTAADAWIAEADVGPPDPRLRALATDVLTALSTFADASLDGVLCFQRYHQVSPGEQPRLLATAARKLSAGGVLYLEVPELGPGGAAGDAYWSNPRNLRPYSFGALLRNLEPLGGEVRTFEGRDVAGAGSARAVLYRKGGAGSG
jgi:hypothetical protein